MIFSLFFVVATMLEFAIVLLIKRKPRRVKKITSKKKIAGNKSMLIKVRSMSLSLAKFSAMLTKEENAKIQPSKGTKNQDLEDQKHDIGNENSNTSIPTHVFVDIISSFIFPISFLFFNIIYWYMVL